MTPSRRLGTQSIERSARLLVCLSRRVPLGWKVADLADHCELDKGTTRRILGALTRYRLVQYHASDKRYLPGPLLFELGLARPEYSQFQREAIACIEKLDVGINIGRFLCIRSEYDFVCAGQVGSLSQGYSLHLGARRPLATSAAGMAIITAHPPAQARNLFVECLSRLPHRADKKTDAIKKMFSCSLQAGIAVNQGYLTMGWSSYAAAVRDKNDVPFASIMITAVTEDFDERRIISVRSALLEAAEQLNVFCQKIELSSTPSREINASHYDLKGTELDETGLTEVHGRT